MHTLRVVALSALLSVSTFQVVCTGQREEDNLGTITFEVSGKREAREHVVRGVKLLHHMMYSEADHEFQQAINVDPTCAIAYWGRAMTILHPLWPDAPTAAEMKEGEGFVQQGLACATMTEREKGYLKTMQVYYEGLTPDKHVERLSALDDAAAAHAQKYSEDLDALAFSALFHLAPARYQAKDKSHRRQIYAADQLRKILEKVPNHPGAQHYKIHAYDFPMLADRALEVCEDYGGIAPDVPHALHMPTHIYTRRGLWEKSIEFNRRAADAARKLDRSTGEVSSHGPHSLDYLAYAYLQRGQFQRAEEVRQELASLAAPFSKLQTAATAFAFAAVPARCALEQKKWDVAAQLPLREPKAFPWMEQYPNCDSIVRYARAIGAARSGKLETARMEIDELRKIHAGLSKGRRAPYWTAQAEAQVLTAQAWVLRAEGKNDEALAAARRAAEIEASIDKEAVTPGEVLPAGDNLGELLLECGKPGDALSAFETVLGSSPNRLNSLYGAALAAERVGDNGKAKQYFEAIIAVGKDADPGTPQVVHAKKYLRM